MPTLKHLLADIEELGASPETVHIPAPLYDELVELAEAEAESENPTENPEE